MVRWTKLSIVLEEQCGYCLFDLFWFFFFLFLFLLEFIFDLDGFDPRVFCGDDLFGYCEFTCFLCFAHFVCLFVCIGSILVAMEVNDFYLLLNNRAGL